MSILLAHAVVLTAAGLLLLMTAVLAVELAAGTWLQGSEAAVMDPRASSYVVVIPAHNEVGTIEHTLTELLPNLTDGGRVLVVADNCTDQTASVARARGAEVVERNDPSHRGKGYAVAHAVRYLSADPPAVVIVLDADCVPARGSLAMLAAAAEHRRCPIQGHYELSAPAADAGPLARVGAFAWRIRNNLRPQGLRALDVPCLLMGTGMAFPWQVISSINLHTGHLVEDMVLGLELAGRGHNPQFMPEASVRSAIPPSVEGQKSQRTRWETGHLQVIRTSVPYLIARSLARRDWRLLFLALHTSVPPLALLVLLLAVVTAGSALIALSGGPVYALSASLAALTVAAGVFTVYWLRAGRDVLMPRELALVPGYVLSKLPLYLRALAGRSLEWVRTKRD